MVSQVLALLFMLAILVTLICQFPSKTAALTGWQQATLVFFVAALWAQVMALASGVDR